MEPTVGTNRTEEPSRAWAAALRAATLLLEAEVCRHVLACRADLSEAQRERLRDASRRAWQEALDLYSPELWERFEIDEPGLRRKAVGLARLRIGGRPAAALRLSREALREALSAA